MRYTPHLLSWNTLAACVLVCLAGVTTAQLAPPEKRGKQIYLRGGGSAGRPVVAYLGEARAEVPASALPCVNCHGYDGRGVPEGGVAPPDITWNALTKPYAVRRDGGRTRPPYDENSLRMAVSAGLDPAGNVLGPVMPRYAFTREEMADLIAYLKRLGDDLDPGLSATSLRLGTLLPAAGPLRPVGDEVAALLRAYFEEINTAGGIFGRRIELEVLPAPPAPAAQAVLEAALGREPLFALVSPFAVDFEAALAGVAEEQQIPVVGSLTLLPEVRSPPDRYSFHLYSGLAEQARAMLEHAAQPSAGKSGVVVVGPEGSVMERVGAALEAECARRGCVSFTRAGYPPGQLAPAALLRGIPAAGAQLCFFLGSGQDLAPLLAEAGRAGWTPDVFLLGSLVGGSVGEVAPGYAGRLYVVYPFASSDPAPPALPEYLALARQHGLSTRHVSFQLSALAAARVLVEALRRAGRDLTREKLVETLEGFYKYETGLSPPVTFGPNQRVGAPEVYIFAAAPGPQWQLVGRRTSPGLVEY